jgi:Zn-dependent protease
MEPIAWRALGIVFFVFVVLRCAGISHALSIAAVTGLAIFAFHLYRHARCTLQLDGRGLTDVERGRSLRWEDITDVQLAEERGCRFVTATGPSGSIEFGDLPFASPRFFGVLNIDAAALALAIVTARTERTELFPPSWRDGSAAAPAPPVGSGDRRYSGEPAVGLVGLLGKLLSNVGTTALALVKSIKPLGLTVALATYTSLFHWRSAIALVILMLVHEFGHAFAMLRSNIPVRGISLIPLLGAITQGGRHADNRADDAYVALSGPAWGAVLALVSAALYGAAGERASGLVVFAAWGALLNLVNLLPLFPVDGGRVVTDVAYSLGGRMGIGVTALALLAAAIAAGFAHLELLVLVVMLGAVELTGALSALPYGSANALLGAARRLGEAEHEHFQRMVSPPAWAPAERAERFERFVHRLAQSRMVPMRPGQAAAVLAAYLAVGAALTGLTMAAADLPGAEGTIAFLR